MTANETAGNITVSVIIPFYGDPKSLKRALSSVLAQDFDEHVEVIVIDDGSPDKPDQVIGTFASVQLVRQVNAGPGPARNHGIDLSRGEFIAFLDADDFWAPEKLRIQVAEMRRTDAAWSHHSCWISDTAGQPLKHLDTRELSGDVRRRVYTSFRVQTSSIMVTRTALELPLIRFSADRVGEDAYFYARLADSFPLHRIPESLSFFTWDGTNAGGKATVQLWSRARLWSAHNQLVRPNTSAAVRTAYRWCSISTKVLNYGAIPPKPTIRNELLARIAYAPAYVIFHAAARRLRQ